MMLGHIERIKDTWNRDGIPHAIMPSIEMAVRLGMAEFLKDGRPYYSDLVDCCASTGDLFLDVLFREDRDGEAKEQFQILVFCLTVLAFTNGKSGVEFGNLRFIGMPQVEFNFTKREEEAFHADVMRRRAKFKEAMYKKREKLYGKSELPSNEQYKPEYVNYHGEMIPDGTYEPIKSK